MAYEAAKEFSWRDRKWKPGESYDPAGLPDDLTRDLKAMGNIREVPEPQPVQEPAPEESSEPARKRKP